jgi:glycosyltransferase involved in cell wall biosynthesis
MFQRSAEMNRQLQKYGAVLVGSAHMYREFEQHGVLPTQLHLVPLPNPESGLSVDSPVRTAPQGRLLFIGRLTRLKGAERLLRAVPIAIDRLGSRLTVTIAGDGPERARLQMLAQRLGVSVHFLGWVDDHRKATLMRESDLLVVPSLWPEPFGLVGIEAGTHGLPAAAYEVGGITDWLIAGHNGELASGDPPTVQGLAAAIVRALSDTEHYLNLCRKARDVASRFSLEAHISRLETILIKVTSEPAATFSAAAERIHA